MRRVDPGTGEVLERIDMPPGWACRALNPTAAIGSSAAEASGKVRAVRRPARRS